MTTQPSLLMRMGCTNVNIAYRAAGNEGVCLESPSHGIQQLAHFNVAVGDFIGVDDILELTPAQVNLSDVANYITSQLIDGGTMLYFDPTGHGQQGTPFAFLQGVSTNVAQLVADGGMKYQPDAITATPVFDTPFTIRAAGLETVNLLATHTDIGPQIINGFSLANGCVLQLASLLNQTLAQANLSDIANYISATDSGGNTILSVDPTGTGQAGTPFAVLEGVSVSLATLLADGALAYTPTATMVDTLNNQGFTYRSAGHETAVLVVPTVHVAASQLTGFSAAAGDAIDVGQILLKAQAPFALASVQADFWTTQSGANTNLWFNANGSGQGGTLEAVLLNTSVTLNQLLAQSAISWRSDQAGTTSLGNGVIMRMGCTNDLITYRSAGKEGVCLQSPSHGVQQLADFSVANGDFLGVDDVLETTLAHDNLSDISQYITSQVVTGGTMLYADPTGHGRQGTPIAFLQGVTTSVAALVAEGGIEYVPDQVAIAPTFDTPFTLRPDGLETVLLNQIEPGIGPQLLYGFNAASGDNLELANILNKTLALPNLSDIGQFISVTDSGGNTTVSVDATGHGLAGTPFAVLEGTSLTLSQLLAANALMYDPTPTWVPSQLGSAFTFRVSGSEGVILQNISGSAQPQTLSGFSLAEGDAIDVRNILSAASVQADLSNIGSYFSTVETGGNTQLWFDPNGLGTGGTLEAVLQNTSLSMTDLLSHSALHLT